MRTATCQSIIEHYNGQVIEAAPEQLADWGGRWTFNGSVTHDTSDVIPLEPGTTMYSTQEEAIEACMNLGRLIVDGKADGYTAQFKAPLRASDAAPF